MLSDTIGQMKMRGIGAKWIKGTPWFTPLTHSMDNAPKKSRMAPYHKYEMSFGCFYDMYANGPN